MATKIRWGILGNAAIARKCVLPAIQRSRNGSVAALASRSTGKARALVRTFNIPRLFDSYEQVLNHPRIDAVYIPLPNHLHAPWTIKALRAGKHVLCEKPLACTGAEARQMAAAAEGAGLLLMEAFMYRFHPRSLRILQMVRRGDLGTLRSVHAAFCYAMDEQLLQSGGNARLRPEMGGGALLDVGCYGVSVARWFFDQEPSEVQAQALFDHNDIDLHLVGLLRFANGGLATVEAGFITALQQTYTVVGNRAVIELPHDAFIPWQKPARYIVRERSENSGQTVELAGVDQYQLMVEHFADAVLGRIPLRYAPQESLGNMQVLDALAQAARSDRTVRIR